MKQYQLKLGDKVAIAKLPEPDRNELLYGLHGIITKIDFNSVLVESEGWSKETGIKQDVTFSEWLPKDVVFKDETTNRYIFEPPHAEFKTKDQRREEEKKKASQRII